MVCSRGICASGFERSVPVFFPFIARRVIWISCRVTLRVYSVTNGRAARHRSVMSHEYLIRRAIDCCSRFVVSYIAEFRHCRHIRLRCHFSFANVYTIVGVLHTCN